MVSCPLCTGDMLAGNVELRRNSSPSLDKLIADVGQPPAALPPDLTNGDAAPQQLPLSAKGSAWHVAARMLVLTRYPQASRGMPVML